MDSNFSSALGDAAKDGIITSQEAKALITNEKLAGLAEAEQIGQTKSGAKLYVNTKGNAGSFLCSHVMRLTTEMKKERPDLISGFIHIPRDPKDDNQTAEVIGIGIKGCFDKLEDKKEVNIMLTGFTQFGKIVPDNSTARFLFGDGVSIEMSSFGFIKPKLENIDQIMRSQFSDIGESLPYSADGAEVGRTYTAGSRKINLILVRLPVDADFTNTEDADNNPAGDGTGNLLKASVEKTAPNAIISLGVGLYGKDETDCYKIEVNAPGMSQAVYNDPIPTENTDLEEIYRT